LCNLLVALLKAVVYVKDAAAQPMLDCRGAMD